MDIFVMATDETGAAIHYGTARQRFLEKVTTETAVQYLKEGQFSPGSMGPKIEAAIQFITGGGNRATITAIDSIEAAVAGKAGTEIIECR